MPIWLLTLIVLAAAGMVVWWFMQSKPAVAKKSRDSEEFDPKIWQPRVVRPLTRTELEAYKVLRDALPDMVLLPQVALSRFVGVRTQRSYTRWFNKVGRRSVDFLVCSKRGDVLGVVELQAKRDTKSSGTQLKTSTLKLAHIPVWHLDLEARAGVELVAHQINLRLAESGAALNSSQQQDSEQWEATMVNPRTAGIEAVEAADVKWEEQPWPTEDNRPSSFLDQTDDSNFASLPAPLSANQRP
jgi:hypothetical protein